MPSFYWAKHQEDEQDFENTKYERPDYPYRGLRDVEIRVKI